MWIGLSFSSTDRGGKPCPECEQHGCRTPLNAEREIPNEPTICLDDEDTGRHDLGQATLVGKVITDKLLNRGAVKVFWIKIGGALVACKWLMWGSICSYLPLIAQRRHRRSLKNRPGM